MKRIFIFGLAFTICQFCASQSSHFELGKQEYDNLNLSLALQYFENDYIEHFAKNPSDLRDLQIAENLLYQAASYFFLRDFDTAQKKVLYALSYKPLCQTKSLTLPGNLQQTCLQKLKQIQQQAENESFQQLINLPLLTANHNLEISTILKQKEIGRKTSYWILGASALPLSFGIGFGVAAFSAKQNFQQIFDSSSQNAWKNYSIAADVSFACAITIVAVGLTLYLLNLELT